MDPRVKPAGEKSEWPTRSPFRGKIEGLSRDLRDPQKIHFVIDDDDESVPSELFEAALGSGFFRA